jgi:predicted  nucleic acid-binding Zn-ribbon protein
MKTKLFLSATLFALLLTSCITKPGDYEALQAERDSLARVQQRMQEEIDSYFATMNQIELNIEKIKKAEKVISMQPVGEDTDMDTRSKITDDLAYINEMLRANKEEIERLKRNLKNSTIKSSELDRTIARLTKALEEETAKVRELETKLEEKDALIYQLSDEIEAISSNIEELKEDNEKKSSKIIEQDETIHTAWYVFGTRVELKEQKIITSDGWFRPGRVLESDFNKSYFVRIDARKTKSIPLYSSKAKILSTHPRSSYSLEKENDSFTLLISNTEEFWSVSKYLVIEVD